MVHFLVVISLPSDPNYAVYCVELPVSPCLKERVVDGVNDVSDEISATEYFCLASEPWS